jgi:hypothetical protein
MKNKYFTNSNLWQEHDVDKVGLPRPFAEPKRKDLAKKVPIPWQSEDRFQSSGHLGLNQKNENNVYKKNLCSYCGIEIKNNETTIRWITAPIELSSEEGPKVFSDFHPLHMECMKQTRIFCPRMRDLKDSDFETGKYKKLKQDAVNDVIKSKELKNEKTIQKDIQS